jgi:beta-mannosidase
VAIVNDTDEPWTGELELARQSLDGAELAADRSPVSVPARDVVVVGVPDALATPDDPAHEALVASIGEVRTVHTFVEDVALALDPDPVMASSTPLPGGFRIQVTARSLALDVTLLADIAAADAEVDRALVTLLAGETAVFEVGTSSADVGQELTTQPVLRTANDLHRADLATRR